MTNRPMILYDFNFLSIHWTDVVSFCSVFDHFQPLTASEVTSNLAIELSDLNYIGFSGPLTPKCFYGFICAYNISYSLQTALEVTNGLSIELSDPNFLF